MTDRRPVVGHLNRRIQLQTAAVIQLPSGDTIIDWEHAETATVNAEWIPGGTRETSFVQTVRTSYVAGIYRINYREPRPSPDTTRIVGHDGVLYDLLPPIELGYRGGWDLPVVGHGEVAA
jgi:hypothetical protein